MDLTFDMIQDYDDFIDQILMISTVESYQKLRVPGKYIYDTNQGETSIEQYNQLCEIEFKKRMQKFLARGLKFPEEQFQEYLEFHKKYQFCKKGFNHRVIISEKSAVHKERRKLALLKLGIDQFSTIYRGAGRVWGQYPNCMILHECLSLQMFNYQYSRFLGLIFDSKKDPFYPQIELDYFNQYHLQVNAYWAEKILERLILKEFGDSPFSSISFDCGEVCEDANIFSQSVDVDKYVTELQDLLEDERFCLERFEQKNFINWCLKSMQTTGIYYMTPHFLEHFEIQEIFDQNVIVWLVNFLSLQLGFFFQITNYDSNHYFDKEGIKRDGIIKFVCVVGSSKIRYLNGPEKQFKNDDSDNKFETEEQKKQRYINHIKFHDRRFRACEIGCQKHIVNEKTGSRYQVSVARINRMNLDELKQEVVNVKREFSRNYAKNGNFHIQGVYDQNQQNLKNEQKGQYMKYYNTRQHSQIKYANEQCNSTVKNENYSRVKDEYDLKVGQTFIIEPSFQVNNNQIQNQEEDNYLINQSDNEDFYEQPSQYNQLINKQKLNSEVQNYLEYAQQMEENSQSNFYKMQKQIKQQFKNEISDNEVGNKEKRFNGHDYVRYLRKEEFKGDKNDQDHYLCPAFVLYERMDIHNSQSPYFLKEFCFLHTHQLNSTKSLPTMWNFLQSRFKQQQDNQA